jgi:hypothetical protein
MSVEVIRAWDKARLDGFVNGHSLVPRPNYSIPLLKAFLNHLPPHPLSVAAARPLERAALISLLQICCRWFEKSKKPGRAA